MEFSQQVNTQKRVRDLWVDRTEVSKALVQLCEVESLTVFLNNRVVPFFYH